MTRYRSVNSHSCNSRVFKIHELLTKVSYYISNPYNITSNRSHPGLPVTTVSFPACSAHVCKPESSHPSYSDGTCTNAHVHLVTCTSPQPVFLDLTFKSQQTPNLNPSNPSHLIPAQSADSFLKYKYQTPLTHPNSPGSSKLRQLINIKSIIHLPLLSRCRRSRRRRSVASRRALGAFPCARCASPACLALCAVCWRLAVGFGASTLR